MYRYRLIWVKGLKNGCCCLYSSSLPVLFFWSLWYIILVWLPTCLDPGDLDEPVPDSTTKCNRLLLILFCVVLPLKARRLCPGFSTSKGELVRSILFPKPVDFKFSQDGMKFVGCLAVIAVIGMLYTLVLMVSKYTVGFLSRLYFFVSCFYLI